MSRSDVNHVTLIVFALFILDNLSPYRADAKCKLRTEQALGFDLQQ